MVAVITAILTILFLSQSTFVYAKSHPVKSALCESENYTCKIIKKKESWASLFPDEEQRDIVMRINRMNTRLYPGLKIAIPNNLSNDPLDYAPFEKQIDPPGQKIIMVSLSKLAFGAYDEEGSLQHWGPVSGGQGYCPDVGRRCNTAKGTFAIYHKGGAGCKSTRYPVGRGGAPMPYCMFFHGNFALHGSPNVPGYNASHGCVRMFTSDAEWLNQDFTSGSRVRVIVY